MAGALVAIGALPVSTLFSSADLVPIVRGGVTDRITAGNFRTQMFAFAATDPLNTGALTAVGNSTITGTLSGITTLTATTGVFTTASTSGLATLGSGSVTGNLNVGTAVGTSKFSVFDSTKTSTVLGANVITWLASNASGADATLGFSDSVANNSYISAKGSILYFQPAVSGTAELLTGGGFVTISNLLAFSAAVSRIQPGATSLSLRNNAGTQDNILISDAGIVTLRGATATAASVGGVSMANNAALRGTNAAVNSAKHLISLNASDRVVLDSDAMGLQISSNRAALGGGAAPTFGTIGGTGPTAAAQSAWWIFYDSAGAATWVPFWR